ncbi:MAG: PEP-CTERM sorting domain-containing protein [Kiritimatiellia bacterium]
MKKKTIIPTLILASVLPASAALMVDWGGDYVTSTQATSRTQTGDNAQMNDGGQSDNVESSFAYDTGTALSPTSGYTAPSGKSGTFYGGNAIARRNSGSSFTATTSLEVIQNGSADRIRFDASNTSVNASTAGAVLVFSKADYLNGFSSQTVSLDQSSNFSLDSLSVNITSLAEYETARFAVVTAGGVYFNSTALVEGSNTRSGADLATDNWSLSTLSSGTSTGMGGGNATGPVLGSTLTDIIGVGLFAFDDNAPSGTSYNLEIDSFSATVIPEPGTLALVGLALGALLLFRRRNA